MEQFVYAGHFDPSELVLMGVVLMGIVALLTWWESRAAGRRLVLLLLVLRMTAIAVVLWMLAGPSHETRVEHRHPKALGIFVDTSGSMNVADPPAETADTMRWLSIIAPDDVPIVLKEMDSASLAIELARARAQQLQQACRTDTRADRVAKLAEQVRRNVTLALGHLDKLADDGQVRVTDAHDDLNRIHRSLKDEVAEEIEQVIDGLQSGRFMLDENGDSRLGKIVRSLERTGGELGPVSETLWARFGEPTDPAGMNLVDAMARRSRLEKVTATLDQAENTWLRDLGDEVNLARYRFDEDVLPVVDANWMRTVPARHDQAALTTDLAAVMQRSALDNAIQPLEAVVVLTDGGHNAKTDPLKSAAGLGNLPVFVVPVGQTKPMRDVVLHHVKGPRTVFVNDTIVIDAMIDAHGCEAEEVAVDLVEGETIVDSVTIPVMSGMYVRRFRFAQKAEELGMHDYRLVAHRLPDERVYDNNEASVSVEVTEDEIRVLLADQWPRWESRYLRNLFKRDKTVEYDEVLLHEAETRQEPARRLPDNMEAWSRYRIVILGDILPSALTHNHQQQLVQYVDQRGGTLILIAGREAMPSAYFDGPLASLLPVEPQAQQLSDSVGYGLYLTSEGAMVPALQLAGDSRASARIWREQYSERLPVYNLSPWSAGKPTSHVLIAASPVTGVQQQARDQRAFLCWQRFGRGRVVYLAAPVTYQLRRQHGDRYHHRFWGNIMRWAIAREMAGGSKTVRFSTDTTRYALDDIVQLRASLSDLEGRPVTQANCRVVARQDDRILATVDLEPLDDQPGTYIGQVSRLPVGPVTLEVTGAEVQSLLASEEHREPVVLTVVIEPDDSLEMRNTQCNLPLLTQLAEQTGGKVIPPTALATAIAQLDLAPTVTEEISRRPLWNRWWVLGIFLGCLTLEWVIRKGVGLA